MPLNRGSHIRLLRLQMVVARGEGLLWKSFRPYQFILTPKDEVGRVLPGLWGLGTCTVEKLQAPVCF